MSWLVTGAYGAHAEEAQVVLWMVIAVCAWLLLGLVLDMAMGGWVATLLTGKARRSTAPDDTAELTVEMTKILEVNGDEEDGNPLASGARDDPVRLWGLRRGQGPPDTKPMRESQNSESMRRMREAARS